jgi:hypothetical protein
MTHATEPTHPALERHYRIQQIAKMWGWGYDTVLREFRDLPGVLKNRIGKRTMYSVPESVLIGYHQRHSGRWDEIQRSRGRV